MSIITGNIYKVNNETLNKVDEVWYIVRSIKNVKLDDKRIWMPQLSPSKELFYKYLNWRKEGRWNKETFEKEYVPTFLFEMKDLAGIAYLDFLEEQGKKKDIMLCCYCEDESLCHRSIILGIIQGRYKLNNYDIYCGENDYSNYFKQYLS